MPNPPTQGRTRLLNLFCGAGGAAMGSEIERAWAAGFFDGEGSVSLVRDKRPGRRVGMQMSIEQVDRRPLLRFMAAVGSDGTVGQRAKPRADNRRLLYRIHLTNGSALSALAAVWPWLAEPKREQIERVLSEVGEERYVQAQAA